MGASQGVGIDMASYMRLFVEALRVGDLRRVLVADTIDARIFMGIHFRAADVQGAGIGADVAKWLDRHFFDRMK